MSPCHFFFQLLLFILFFPRLWQCGSLAPVDVLAITNSVQQCRNIGLGIEASLVEV